MKSVGGEITVGVRPQDVWVSKIKEDNGALSAVVDLTQFQGESVIVTLVLDDQGKTEVKAVIEADWLPQQGERVWLGMAPETIHLFDGEIPILR